MTEDLAAAPRAEHVPATVPEKTTVLHGAEIALLNLLTASFAVFAGDFMREDTERADALFVGLERAMRAALEFIPRGLCQCQPTGDGFFVCPLCKAADTLTRKAS